MKVARDMATADQSNLVNVVGLVYDELHVAQSAGTNTLTARTGVIMNQVRELERVILHTSINRVFVVTHSHYENIDLEALSEGYPDGYELHELAALEAKVLPLSQALSD